MRSMLFWMRTSRPSSSSFCTSAFPSGLSWVMFMIQVYFTLLATLTPDCTIPPGKYQVPNTKCQIPNTKYQMPNTKYQITNNKYQIPNTKYQMLNTKWWIPKTKYQMVNIKWRIPNTNYQIPWHAWRHRTAQSHPPQLSPVREQLWRRCHNLPGNRG